MAKQSIQGFVELASGLGELTKSRALEAANEILALSGLEGSGKKMGKQASVLADDLISAARANRKQLEALVRREVDSAMGRVDLGRLAADVNAVTAAVTALAGQLEEVATLVAARVRFSSTEVAEPYIEAPAAVPARVSVTTGGVRRSSFSGAGAAKKAPAKKAPAKKAAVKKAPAKKAAVKKAPAKKAAVKKAPAKKAPAKKAPAKKAAVKKAPAKKAPVKKAPAGG